MIEAVSQVVTMLVLGAGAVAVVRELVLYRRLSGELREWPRRLGVEVPRVTDTRQLEGFEGERDGVCWRWDAERRTLRFRRRFFQRAGHLVSGSLRFDADGEAYLAYRPVPLRLFVAFGAFAAWGMVGLALNEGPLLVLVGAPIAPLCVLPVALLHLWSVRRILNRDVLPVIVDEIRRRVAGPLTPG